MSTAYCAKHNLVFTASCSGCLAEKDGRADAPHGWLLATFDSIDAQSAEAAKAVVDGLNAELSRLLSENAAIAKERDDARAEALAQNNVWFRESEEAQARAEAAEKALAEARVLLATCRVELTTTAETYQQIKFHQERLAVMRVLKQIDAAFLKAAEEKAPEKPSACPKCGETLMPIQSVDGPVRVCPRLCSEKPSAEPAGCKDEEAARGEA